MVFADQDQLSSESFPLGFSHNLENLKLKNRGEKKPGLVPNYAHTHTHTHTQRPCEILFPRFAEKESTLQPNSVLKFSR
jgi:hypothetical protein